MNHTSSSTSNSDFEDFTNITDTVTAGVVQILPPVMMGTSTAPAQNLLGLAAELKLDGISLSQPLYTTETNSWLNYQMAFKKSIAANRMDISYSRTSGTGMYGYGILFYVNLVLPNSSIGDTLNLYFDNVTMLDPQGNVLTNYNVLPLTATVEDPLGINDLEVIKYASVIPNPSSGQTKLEISNQNNSLIIVTINDLTGKILWCSTISGNGSTQRMQLPEELVAGMYIINIKADNKNQQVKWLKL